MTKIVPIEYNSYDILECISLRFREKAFNKSIVECKSRIVELFEAYNKLVNLSVTSVQNCCLMIDSELLIKSYTTKFRNKDYEWRAYYDAIKLSSMHNICPYCLVGTANTVDHYLPKETYPMYSVHSYNLIPACRDCNTNKGSKIPFNDNEFFVNPQYDSLCDYEWLSVHIIIDKSIGFKYSINDKMKDENEYSKLSFHFEKLELSMLYSSNSSSQFSGERKEFKDIFDSKGPSILKDEICKRRDSWISGHGVGHWKSAYYQSIVECDTLMNDYLKQLANV